MNQSVNRRDFLKTSSQAAGGLAAAAMLSHSRKILAANDTVGVAIVGTRGRGKEHMLGFHRQPGVKIL
ncbi:MAG: dehydrogenase, partial [Acidobacteria bacterium]